MEMYNFSEQGNAESYMIQGAETNPHLTNPLLEQVQAMYNEGVPEFVVDQGLYYPSATNYGYYSTGLESPSEWEDHHRIFGVDGPDFQYVGMLTESSPYVYYTPDYGYAQSPYNPYNPYIPGATIGVDGSFVGAQQYYTIPPYQNPVSSPGYIPVVVQPDIIPNRSDPLLDSGASVANRSDERAFKHHFASASGAFSRNPPKPATNQTNFLTRVSDGPRANIGPSKQPVMHGGVSSGVFPAPAPSRVFPAPAPNRVFPAPAPNRAFQVRTTAASIQPMDNISAGKNLFRSQLKGSLPVSNGFSDFGSNGHGQAAIDKLRPNIYSGRALNEANGSADTLGEQNRGPRTNRLKNQLVVKAYTTKAGDSNAQGNILINTDQYNKDGFPVGSVDAKFFVIKSYSEDDVHKSIKYNLWSSTPHGNKKLQIAYEDAQKLASEKPSGCPIFLFFSVNASGQFCGVAEMVGSVDFHKDMDFWQQDKWSGSFSVKWHIIKDVPNTNFRHIILENNENKPVTNSRDTQEIMHKQGLEMLKIFRDHAMKTSLFDDFMYYENRQRIMQEEKAGLLNKSFGSPFLVPELDSANKGTFVGQLLPNKDEKIGKHDDLNGLKISMVSSDDQSYLSSDVTNASNMSEYAEQIAVEVKDEIISTLRIGSPSINPKQAESKPVADAAVAVATEPVGVLTVGSMPVKVNGYAESSNVLTVGTIPLDPRSLQQKIGSK